MSSSTILRVAAAARKPQASWLRTQAPTISRLPLPVRSQPAVTSFQRVNEFSTSVKRQSDQHGEETFEEFSARFEKEFDNVQDVFELQRNLNNAFAYDLVPSPSVCTAALRAARRVNDYPTAVRVFEGIKAKVENRGQYHEYLRDLAPIREELGVDLKDDLFPELRNPKMY